MSDALTHYIVVRRDLPVGVIYAQIAHAAGESFYQLASRGWTMPSDSIFPGSSVLEHQTFSLEVGGSTPSRGSTFVAAETIVVVLGARNEQRLKRLEIALLDTGVIFTSIRETEGTYRGQLMAIGLMPGPKSVLAQHINQFHMFTDTPAVTETVT